jgi:hypothetical protein
VLGVVTDQTGAVAPGATVTLTNDATGASFTTVTTGAGTYTFEAIQVGNYSLAVELQGFKKFISTVLLLPVPAIPGHQHCARERGRHRLE